MDSTTRRIEVRGPRGSFTYESLKGCVAFTVNFTAITSGSTSITWDFNDGTTLSTTDSLVSHTYLWAGEFIPKMILHDANGCSVAIVGPDTIRAIDASVNFGLDQYLFCDSGYTRFYDATISNDLITNWHWDFGDGTYSNNQNPVHHYTIPGVYPVILVVTTETGCTDSLLLPDTIKVYARPSIAILGDSAACIPARLDFRGHVIYGDSSLLNWYWDLGNGNSVQQQDPPPQTYSLPGDYIITAIVTDEHSCRDTAIKTVHAFPLPVTNAGPDLLVCAESSAQLSATGASTYQWDASAELSCINCGNPIATPSHDTLYAVTGFNQHGCSDRDSLAIRVQQRFNMLVSPGDTICAGQSVQLAAAGAHLYTWSPASGLNNPAIASPRATPGASTVYYVIGSDSTHCFTDTGAVFIKVYPVPTVEAGPDVTITVGSGTQLHTTTTGDVILWNWVPGTGLSCTTCPDPFASPKQTTRYRVDVINEGRCPANDYITINVVCGNGNIYIPNTFSPNGDGMNDRFYPRGKGLYTIRALRIFNRWGEIVFEQSNFNPNDPSMGWDGRYKGQVLSPDVFLYICDILCENNQVITVKGDITLLQ
jgi:gliding motility-associated-like protein